MIHQELANAPARSVRSNLWLGREPTRRVGPLRLLDHRKMRSDTAALMHKLGMDIDPDAIIGELSISHQQACEIAKAVAEIVTQEADVKTSQPRSRVSWKASTPARSRTRSRPRSPPSGLWARSIFTRMLRAHIHLRVRPPVILAIPPGPHPAEWRP